jgi:tRNA-Thr(GGU) m(6)t(6)A37 methyltransferase TsaA
MGVRLRDLACGHDYCVGGKYGDFVGAMKTKRSEGFMVRPIGVVRSTLKKRSEAPKQGSEGAPDAWIEIEPWALGGLHRMKAGDKVWVITWFHEAHREVLQVHPRSDPERALTGVFATRSPDRPNPLGLHPVTVLEIKGNRLRVEPIEAIDGTPVVDMKPILTC